MPKYASLCGHGRGLVSLVSRGGTLPGCSIDWLLTKASQCSRRAVYEVGYKTLQQRNNATASLGIESLEIRGRLVSAGSTSRSSSSRNLLHVLFSVQSYFLCFAAAGNSAVLVYRGNKDLDTEPASDSYLASSCSGDITRIKLCL